MAKKRKSNAPAAEDSADMSVPMPTPTGKRRSRPKYPLYEESELRIILRFLAAYLTEFEGKLAGEREIAKGDESHPLLAGRIKFRQHQVTTIHELVKRAYWPQKHLALVTDEEILCRVTESLKHSGTT